MTAAANSNAPAALDRASAFEKAVEIFGEGAVVGFGIVLKASSPVHYVGKRAGGDLLYLGVGNTWEEAFKNTRQLGFKLAAAAVVEAKP